MDEGDDTRRGTVTLSRVLRLAAVVACALLGVAANALPARAQQLGFVVLSGVLAASAWFLLVLAWPRGRGPLRELSICLVPALAGGLLGALGVQAPEVRDLTSHLWIEPAPAGFLSGLTAAGMTTYLARAKLAPRGSPGA